MSENEKRQTTIRIGIDPGKKGALAFIITPSGADASVVETYPFDKDMYVDQLWALMAAFGGDGRTPDVKCVIERVHAMPGQGSVSMFSFGENYGWILGVLDTLEIPYETVEPRKWKKEFGVTSDKNTSVEVARRLFPKNDLRRTDRCTKDDDGIAEALLMAEYARRRM